MEVIIGSGEGWQWALSWMTWEGYMRQKKDDRVSERGRKRSRIPTIYHNVLPRVSSDQTEMGDRLGVS